MSLHWINISPKLKDGVALINSMGISKFNLLLKHIIQSKEELFTQFELSKLSESLKLNQVKVQLLVQSIAYIFNQSSRIILKPTILQEQLIENLKFNHDKAQDFVKIWIQETKNNFDIENSKSLNTITWELNIQSASNCCNKEKHINTHLQFALASIDGKQSEHIILELDEDKLVNLYNTLENIQNTLDSI